MTAVPVKSGALVAVVAIAVIEELTLVAGSATLVGKDWRRSRPRVRYIEVDP
jgi:hypothetical protein